MTDWPHFSWYFSHQIYKTLIITNTSAKAVPKSNARDLTQRLFTEICYSNTQATQRTRSSLSACGQLELGDLRSRYNTHIKKIRKGDPAAIALGFFKSTDNKGGELQRFALQIKQETGEIVVSWNDFVTVGLLTEFRYNNKTLLFPEMEVQYAAMMQNLNLAISNSIERSNGKPAIYFTLNRFSVKKGFKGGRPHGVTSNEAYLVLNTPKFLNATHWYLNGVKLSTQEVRNYFGEHYLFISLIPERAKIHSSEVSINFSKS